MYKCDKCGCEHSQRTVCPRCGAPVIIVNQDYLLRREQWEKQQREQLQYKKQEEDRKKTAEPARERKNGSSEKNGIYNAQKRESRKADKPAEKREAKKTNGISEKLRALRSERAEKKKKIEKDKNANELKDNRRERRQRLERRRMLMAVAVAAGIILSVTAGIVGYGIYKSIDRSDVRYFDGHELVSVREGVLLDIESGAGIGALLSYAEGLNAILFDNGASLAGWYEGREFELFSDMGEITDEYMFSESGRYLAYVLYSEPDELYSLVIYDLADGSSRIYDGERRIKLIAVSDDGRVLYDELETTGYSTVVSMNLYAADISKKLLVAENVTAATYDSIYDNAVFIKDEKLYICSLSEECLDRYEGIISDREHILVNEGVIAIVDNRLSEAVMYTTDDGLWVYEEGMSRLAAEAVDSSAEIYYDGAGSLYYRMLDRLYYVEQKSISEQKSVSMQDYLEAGNLPDTGRKELILSGLSGDIVVSEDGNIWCLDSDGNLYCSRKSEKKGDGGRLYLIEAGVTACGSLYGVDGCAFIKDGQLICFYGGDKKKRLVLGEAGEKSALSCRAVSSGKYLYYVDSSSVLWKIAKKGSDRESLGFVNLFGLKN